MTSSSPPARGVPDTHPLDLPFHSGDRPRFATTGGDLIRSVSPSGTCLPRVHRVSLPPTGDSSRKLGCIPLTDGKGRRPVRHSFARGAPVACSWDLPFHSGDRPRFATTGGDLIRSVSLSGPCQSRVSWVSLPSPGDHLLSCLQSKQPRAHHPGGRPVLRRLPHERQTRRTWKWACPEYRHCLSGPRRRAEIPRRLGRTERTIARTRSPTSEGGKCLRFGRLARHARKQEVIAPSAVHHCACMGGTPPHPWYWRDPPLLERDERRAVGR